MINNKKIFKDLATLGFLGYFWAPGTFGSILGFCIAYLLFYFINNIFINFFISLIIFFVSLFIIKKSLIFFEKPGQKVDPSEIIIDEFAASFFVLFSIDLNIKNVILAFIIFRFLDITKFFGISYTEKYFNGSFAILIDDIVAAFLTCFLLNILNYFSYLI